MEIQSYIPILCPNVLKKDEITCALLHGYSKCLINEVLVNPTQRRRGILRLIFKTVI